MTTVTIPTDYNPFVVKVNNVEYFYKAGDTVEVPDEVAEVISRFEEAKVPEPEKLEYVEGFSYDPVADAGKVLQVRDDGRGIEWGEGSGEGGGGSQITVEPLSVTKNDVYTAEEGTAYSPVTVNVSGGESDFSTAEITINSNKGIGIICSLPVVFDENEAGEGAPAIIYTVSTEHTGKIKIALYKGAAAVEIPYGDITVSGDIQSLGSFMYLITGDCTITIEETPDI